jgi:tRNA threonylcarbamoyladenosine biosynthesis protein TsaE
MKSFITNSEQETFDFAKNFAGSLQGGEVIALEGDLGAGKTVFTKGLAEGLGFRKTVTSPTFVVMKVYDIENTKSSIRRLVHIDAYRLDSAQSASTIGAEEYFGSLDTVTVIEWPEKIKNILPHSVISIKISIKEKEKRVIEIKK